MLHLHNSLFTAVNAACYPGCKDMFRHQFSNGTGTRCWMAGYGYNKDKKTPFKTLLRKIDIAIMPDNGKYLFTFNDLYHICYFLFLHCQLNAKIE